MVDYSKWDNFEADLSDDDEVIGNAPVVTKIEKEGGGTIRIGPQGSEILDRPDPSSADKKQLTFESLDMSSLTRNGDALDEYLWCQDRTDVVVRTKVPTQLKSRDIVVELDIDNKLLVRDKSTSTILLSGILQNFIVTNSPDSGECVVDWELKNIGPQRFLEVTFKKKSPIPGAVMWWRNVFKGHREIDLTKIEGRNTSSSAEANRDAWQQAQEIFKSKVRQVEPVEIFLPDTSTTEGSHSMDEPENLKGFNEEHGEEGGDEGGTTSGTVVDDGIGQISTGTTVMDHALMSQDRSEDI